MIYDLRYREVPASLTLIPLLLAAIYALIYFRWILVAFVILLILISDFKIQSGRLFLAIVLLAISSFIDPGSMLELFSIFSFWSFWEVGAMGGADAKLMMTILLILGNPLVILPVAIIGGLQGLVALIRKEKSIPYLVAIFFGTFIFIMNSIF
jgi:hypothetical protein